MIITKVSTNVRKYTKTSTRDQINARKFNKNIQHVTKVRRDPKSFKTYERKLNLELEML